MNIEELEKAYVELQEQNKILQAQQSEMQKAQEENLKRIASLTETNNALFMKVTKPVEEQEPEKEKTPEQAEAEEIEEIRKLMAKRRS